MGSFLTFAATRRRPVLWWLAQKFYQRKPADLSDVVLHQCVCGSELFEVLCTFSDYQLATYSTTMWCANCSAAVGAPTPLDDPDREDD